jgi:hypothetical protein
MAGTRLRLRTVSSPSTTPRKKVGRNRKTLRWNSANRKLLMRMALRGRKWRCRPVRM